MKVLNRGLAIVLAGVLILGGEAAFAVSPNANPNALNNPARIKAMEKTGNVMDVMSGIVDDVDIKIIPMENGNVGLIEGEIDLKTGQNFENFKGNTKLKVKLNNVTVNINEYGEFSQPMPMWKIEPLSVRVFMGKVLVYSNVEDDLDEIRDKIGLERALDRAETAISRLPEDLDDLELEDLNLVRRARLAVDILKEVIDEGTREEKALYNKYLDLVEEAEEIMSELLADLIEWEIELTELEEGSGMYYGKLSINKRISESLMVIVDFDDVDEVDLELEVGPNGHVWFQTEETDFEVRVELNEFEIEELRVEFD